MMSTGLIFPFQNLMVAAAPMLFAVVGIVLSVIGARRWENAGWWVIFSAQVLRLCTSPLGLFFRYVPVERERLFAIVRLTSAVGYLAGIIFLVGLGILAFGSTRRRMEEVAIPADSGPRPPLPRREN